MPGFDNLVNDAERNHGQSSQPYSPTPKVNSESFPVRVTPSYKIEEDGYRGADLRTYNFDRHRGEYSPFQHNLEQQRTCNIRILQNSLINSQMLPLAIPCLQLRQPSLPQRIIETAEYFSSLCGLQPTGLIYAVLGATSIASWGRISISLREGWSESAIDMILQVTDSGRRKSSLIAGLRKPFDQFSQTRNEDFDACLRQKKAKAGLSQNAVATRSRKKIRAALDNSAGLPFEEEFEALSKTIDEAVDFEEAFNASVAIPNRVQLLYDEATPFQLALTLAEQGECQGVLSAEGGLFKSKLVRASGARAANGTLFLRGHTQEPYVYENAKKRIHLSHPALPMVNLVQPIVASNFYAMEELNSIGVTARFMPFFYQTTDGVGTDLQRTYLHTDYNKKISELLEKFYTQDLSAERFQVKVASDALRAIDEFEENIRLNVIPNMPENSIACFCKAHGQAVRFAWDIHAWNYANPERYRITKAEMQQGIDLVSSAIEHIRFAYAPEGLCALNVAKKIIESLKHIDNPLEQENIINNGYDSTRLQQRTGHNSREVNNALHLLDQHNYLAIYDDSSNNLRVTLHPYFYGNP